MQLPKPSESGSFELTPAGTHVAICYRFIDRGTQMTEYMGDKKTRREVMLTWELPDEKMVDGRPFSASKTYTWSMNEKATLRKDLEAWRGRAFTDDDFEGDNTFNTRKLLGAPCMLTIMHETKGDKTWAKIVSVSKLVKGMPIPTLTNPLTYLALAEGGWDAAAYKGLSEKMQQVIAASPEYGDLMQKMHRHDDPGGYPDNYAGGDPNDQIPF